MKTMDELVAWFQSTFPRLVKEMKDCNHHYDLENLNPYHLEGDVFTHVMQVCLMARHSSPVVQMAALLHDIGKPLSKKFDHERKYTMFTNHESISAFMSLDVLKKVDWLTDDEKIQVFRIIAHHTDPFKLSVTQLNALFIDEPELSHLVKETSICDHLGRFTTKPNEDKEFSYNFREPLPTRDGNCIVLVALPNGGKSTRTKELISQGYHVVSSDDIIMEMSPNMTYNEAYNSVDHKELTKEFNIRLQKATKYDKVVIDTCNLSKKRRVNLVNIFKKTHNVNCEVLLVPLTELNRRNDERSKLGKNIPESVYEQMIKGFYPPTLSENFTSIDWRLL